MHVNTPRDFFTVSRVVEMTGIPLETLDMLERELGSDFEIRRTSGGNRLFTPKDIANIQEIQRLLGEDGNSLSEVRDIVFSRSRRRDTGSRSDVADTLPGMTMDDLKSRMQSTAVDPDSLAGARVHLDVVSDNDQPLPVEVRSRRAIWEGVDPASTLSPSTAHGVLDADAMDPPAQEGETPPVTGDRPDPDGDRMLQAGPGRSRCRHYRWVPPWICCWRPPRVSSRRT